jgi:hypothetical protein
MHDSGQKRVMVTNMHGGSQKRAAVASGCQKKGDGDEKCMVAESSSSICIGGAAPVDS